MNNCLKRSVALLMAVLAVAVMTAMPVGAAGTSDYDEYRSYLRGLGFPDSYVDRLYELHLLHPSWSFEPLMVTQLNSKYTWEYCLYMETDDNPKRSLISASEAFAAYRHSTNTQKYDSGWYQASAAAVSYFMDPRNFLNEKDIFQFEDLSFRDSITVSQVETALAGTFMDGAKLENGYTYAEYFYEVGRELGINPIHLASRARQEQGSGRGAQINGSCGDKLWYYYSNNIQTENGALVYAPSSGYTEAQLKSYNGLYNFFNINASGTGRFAILLGAMKEAETGTASMADKWGGSPSWDTKWKSIYGGAVKLSNSYIGNYQNTLYLQKWNVDNRSKSASGGSRNFWGQYMQNIGAALSEARNSYTSVAAGDCLDCPFTFVIPVYSGMPDASCPDPAAGKCEYYATSPSKYSSRNHLSMYTDCPECINTYVNTFEIPHTAGEVLSVTGSSLHSCVPQAYEYSIDGGEWVAMSGTHEDKLTITDKAFSGCAAPEVPYYFSAEVPAEALTVGKHVVAVRGRVGFDVTDNTRNNVRYYLIAAVHVTVSKPAVTVTVKGDTEQTEQVEAGSVYTLPQAPAPTEPNYHFAGWLVTVQGQSEMLLPAGAGVMADGNITISPLYLFIGMRYGASAKIAEVSALRFNGIVDRDGYEKLRSVVGDDKVSCGLIICPTPVDGLSTLDTAELAARSIAYKKTVAESWRQTAMPGGYYAFSGDTDAIPVSDRNTGYSAAAYVCIVYSNSATACLFSDYSPDWSCRSVAQVWSAARAVGSPRYSSAELDVMRTFD